VEEKEGRKNNHKKKTPAFGDFVLGDFGECVCVFFCSSSFGFCGFCDKQVTCLQHRERQRETEEVRKGRREGRRKEGGKEAELLD